MPKAGTIRELLNYIIRVRTEMVRAYGDDDFPVLAQPASRQAIILAEAHLGLSFPPSYGEFLSESNGVRDFSDEIDLVSVEDILSSEYAATCESIRDLGWQIGERLLVEGLVIGCRPGYRNVFVIDTTVEADERGEQPVVYWSDSALLRAADFRAFLGEWCDVAYGLLVDARQKAHKVQPGSPMPRPPRQD